MRKLIDFLDGKKTYIIAAVIGIATALNYLGVIDPEIYGTIMALLGAGGVAALRAGVKKSAE